MEKLTRISANLVDALGSRRFYNAMFVSCQSVVDFDSAILLAFDSHKRKPYCLATRFDGPDFEVANKLYLDKHFNECQAIAKLEMKKGEKNIALIRQSVNDIVDPVYRRDLYEKPKIAHDLMLLDRVGSTFFNLEFFRSQGKESFSEGEERELKSIWPLVLACIQKHLVLQKLPKSTSHPRELQQSLNKLFMSKGLSKRESEVCSYIALGYSTLAISLHLSISINTVSTLRQRAYSKLNISCMNELYSLYLHSLGNALENAQSEWELIDSRKNVALA